MPNYCFKCLGCGESAEVFRPMRDFALPETCKCGALMHRDLRVEHSAVRGDYNKSIMSISMAFNTQDLEEHRRQHPNIELKVDKAGRTAYPIFRNLSQKRAYLKARKWVDRNSFT